MNSGDPQLPLDIPLTLAPRQSRVPVSRSGPHTVLAHAQIRLFTLGLALAAGFAVVALRLIDATVLQPNLAAPAISAGPDQPGAASVLRADILDRNSEVLATSLPTQSLYADPAKLLDPVVAARALVKVLPDLKYEDVLDKLSSARRFIWLKRNLTPDEVYKVNALGQPGLEFQSESTRLYPAGATTVHALGFTDVDGHGLGGIERGLDKQLSAGGKPVTLSIDLRVQHMVERELQLAIKDFNALGGAGIVIDAWTGEVLAAVSLPDYAPLDAGKASDEARFNRFALGTYELGSVMKTMTVAAALETGRVTLGSFFNADEPIRSGRFTINDYHPMHRWLSVGEVFIHSSNLGAARIALEIGPPVLKEFFCKVGLCQDLKTELSESGDAIIPPGEWKDISAMTISFGHGLSVTPLHLVRATAATITGHLPTITFLKQPEADGPLGKEIISAHTVDQMRRVMRANVVAGSGKTANVPGYFVGGKTGTAEKTTGRRYNRDARLSSFVGAFPMNNPRYVVYAMIDEPHPNASSHGYATGGWVASPVVGSIINQLGPLFAMAPQSMDDPDVRKALELVIKSRDEPIETY